MVYQALYRKWRSMTFDDVIGQNHITKTLKNEIISDKTAHAYIFTGTRGTGKTSTAKILSRAVNCESPQDGNPCNVCSVCKGILSESILDIIEIDAASNTGVENIRSIIQQVQYLSTVGRKKVYIIDEVHMLSAGAFNALLKTLEEPPEHVMFILATTEIQKVPATILSRCQRFDFKSISVEDISKRIKYILENENITAHDEAIKYIAYLGDGSMRDALSILDQCLAFKQNDLTYKDVIDIVGNLDDSVLFDIAGMVASQDVGGVISSFDGAVSDGKNTDNFTQSLLNVYRELLITIVTENYSSYSVEKDNKLKELAIKYTKEKVINCIGILSDVINNIKFASSPRVIIEVGLIKMTLPKVDYTYDSLLDRLSCLEQAVSIGVIPEKPKGPQIKKEEKKKTTKKAVSIESADIQNVVSNWNKVLSKITEDKNMTLYIDLHSANPECDGDKLVLVFDNDDKVKKLSKKTEISKIKDYVESVFNIEVNIECANKNQAPENEANDIFGNIANFSKEFPDNFRIDEN